MPILQLAVFYGAFCRGIDRYTPDIELIGSPGATLGSLAIMTGSEWHDKVAGGYLARVPLNSRKTAAGT